MPASTGMCFKVKVSGHGGMRRDESQQACAKWHFMFGDAKRDLAKCVVKARDQALGHDGADLFRREVHDSDDELAHQRLGLIQACDLRTRLAQTNLGTKVDLQSVSRLACLRKGLGRDDLANAEFNLCKVAPFDCLHCLCLSGLTNERDLPGRGPRLFCSLESDLAKSLFALHGVMLPTNSGFRKR